MKALLLALVLLFAASPAVALTVSWDCNPEPDVTAYRVEYSKDAGATWGKWGATEYTFANWKVNSGQDANTVEVDPQLPSINTGDWPASNLFVLRTSPMFHAGKHAQGARDARGRRYYMGGRPTIRPYEYSSGDPAGERALR